MFKAKNESLDWKVRKESISTESGILIETHKSIVRDDNSKVLSIMKKDYNPYQNEELLELLNKVGGSTGMEIANKGYFGNGEKVFIQLKSDNLTLGNDRVEGYLTGINSFDGSTTLAFGPSTITISCQNTFFASFKELSNRVRHTKNMHLKIEDFLRGIELVKKEEGILFDNIKKLSEVKMVTKNEEMVIRTLFNIEKDVNLSDFDALSTVTRNRIDRFKIDLFNEVKEKGDNLWGLFSGVTKYTTHTMNNGEFDRNVEAKMTSFYGNREREIFNKLVAGI